MRNGLLALVQGRVQQMAATGDLSAASNPRAIAQARRLAETLAKADLVEVRIALGWWHWFRYRASSENVRDQDFAVRLLVPCFLAEAGPLPEPLLPLIAMAAVEPAVSLVRDVVDSADLEFLASATRLWRRIIAVIPDSAPEQSFYLSILSGLVMQRFECTHDPADLDKAIDASFTALKAASVYDKSNPRYLYDYGQTLLVRFELLGDLKDLKTAAASLLRAIEVGTRDEIRPFALYQLGRDMHRHFMATGAREDLDVSIAVLEIAVRAASPVEEYWSKCVSGLGGMLMVRYERWGEADGLDRAIEVYQRALAVESNESLEGMLSLALLARFKRNRDPADLDAAAVLLEPAPDFIPTDTQQAERLTQWGEILKTRFEETGELADLNASLEAHRQAIQTPCAPKAHRYSSYANAMRARYNRTGDLSDLDEAITVHRRALDLDGGEEHHDIAILYNNLGIALLDRFERTSETTDLDEAVDMQRQAVASVTADHSQWGMVNANLGLALIRRYEIAEAEGDLRQAVAALRIAVAVTPVGHRDHGINLANLGGALLFQHRRGADRAVLTEARDMLREAVESLPQDHIEQSVAQFNLAESLLASIPDADEEPQRLAAMAAFIRAAETSTAPYAARIRAYKEAAKLAAESDPSRAVDLLEAAVSLLPRLAPRQLARQDQQHLLAEFATMTNDAAALALASPDRDAARALQLLETGRSVLYAQGLGARADLNMLRARAPELADRFSALSDLLGRSAIPSGIGSQGGSSQDRHRIAMELSETIDAIRRLEGFSSFLELPPVPDLLREAEQGPVVVFNVSHYRSDALLVTPDGVEALPLPGLELHVTMENIRRLSEAVTLAHVPNATVISTLAELGAPVTPTLAPAMAAVGRMAAQDAMNAMLDWLWQVAAEPVLDRLGLVNTPGPDDIWPRVWWATGGILGLLPFHASGQVMQRVVSSYIPTVRALQYARRRTIPLDRQPQHALVVTMPPTPGESALQRAADEAATVQAQLPSCTFLAPGTPLASTKENVLSGLDTHTIVHFACHAVMHPTDPFQSMLLLQDYATDPFTVESLSPVRLDHAELAYLSACETATGVTDQLNDEAIHLAIAFQLAGFRHVIGTLWGIEDNIAVDVAEAFYRGLGTSSGGIDTGQAAFALHSAIQGQRVRFPRTPSLWAGYVHIGA